MRIAIVGAGAAGLTAAKNSLEEGFEIEIFEQTGNIGGTWVYTDQTGVDNYGLAIHTSMYQGLRTNLPKELMEYCDFRYPESQRKSFIEQKDVLKYMEDYTKHFQLNKYIKFYHQIIQIEPLPDERWRIRYKNLVDNQEMVQEFDAVFLCNGHYCDAIIPDIPGKNSFKGNLTHSHDYRSTKPFVNKRILLIGAGPSGVDIARLLSPVAKNVYISYKNEVFGRLPPNVIGKPRPVLIKDNTVKFQNEEEIEVDEIICCTGYYYSFPFLAESCGIEIDNNWVKPLYKQVININHPTMALIGIPIKICPFPINELQVKFFLSYLKGNFEVTNQQMMDDLMEEVEQLKKKGVKKPHYHLLGADQEKYCDMLASVAHIYPLKPVLSKLYMFHRNLFNLQCIYKIINDEEFVHEIPIDSE